jgi:hypothetical protein
MSNAPAPFAPLTTVPTAAPADCRADHRPYAHGEVMPVRVVRDVLDSHGVASRVASDGALLVWESATVRTVSGVRDASAWVVLAPEACTLAAWLGY